MLNNREARIVDISEMIGYESATQFSREYKRLFGSSPIRHRNGA
ncbi:MAG: AraC family transcriptional regulator [Desulfovibrio sp.]|nr:AraC family transcriptional regulator [Desulfovibrio sp.]